MRRRWALSAAIVLAWSGAASAEARPLRIMSLDQCGDQYALALRPDAELALSPRADNPDSWLRQAAAGRRRVRPTLEAAIAFNPDVVVRYWGGEPRLLAALEARGVRVLTIEDAVEMEGVRDNIRSVAAGLDADARGEALQAHMTDRLAQAATPHEAPASALYLTPGGFTAGRGTLMDAILKAAGFANLAPSPGFQPVSVERIALSPPHRFILGMFDRLRDDWRGPGRHPVIQSAAKGHVAARLPATALSCPAWFAADAAAMARAGA